jgi:hypothetical protein
MKLSTVDLLIMHAVHSVGSLVGSIVADERRSLHGLVQREHFDRLNFTMLSEEVNKVLLGRLLLIEILNVDVASR